MNNPELIELFLKVAGIEGLSGKEKNVATFIVKFLSELNLSFTEDESQKKTFSDTGNIICQIGNGGDFLLSCHMDTARSTKNMKHLVHKDRISSDGNTVLGVDNRAGVALLLFLVKKIVTEKIEHKDFSISFVTCEESTLAGSRNLQLKKNIKRAFVFDSYMRPGNYIASSVGAAGYKVKVIGKAAHSGIEPEKGINALRIAADAICKIKLGKIDNISTSNIGIIKGGTATNVVPDLIEIEGEVRSLNKDDVLEKINDIKSVFGQCADSFGGKIDFEWVWDFVPFNLSGDIQVIKEIESAIERANIIPRQALSYGGSDANSFNERGIETVNIGIGAQNPHSNDEFILLEDLDNAFQIALELIKK